MAPRPATWTRRRLLGAGGAAALLGACSSPRRPAGAGPGTGGAASGPGKPLVIGVVTPMTGPYAGAGAVVTAALTATSRHIEVDIGGSVAGYRPVFVSADAPLVAADGQRAYARLKARGVDAVLWCGAPGLAETVPSIVSDLTPVVAVGTDLQGRFGTDPHIPDLASGDARGFPVFQLDVPIGDAFDLLAAYGSGDRGFQTSAVVWRATETGADTAWAKACAAHGLDVVASPSFDASAGPPDFGAVTAALHRAAPHLVVVVGAAPDAAALAAQLDALGARYTDTPTARTSFSPMIAGVAGATGTVMFSILGGAHAAKGTIAAATLGAATGLPRAPVRDWLARHVSGYGVPRGGEDGPADAVAALLSAAGAARSTAAPDLVAALEAGGSTTFATAVPVGFTGTRHVAPQRGDLALLTLEGLPEARYDLGREWGTVFPSGTRSPDLLLDPTLADNRAAHPAVMSEVLDAGFGISSSAAYQEDDAGKQAACRAIH